MKTDGRIKIQDARNLGEVTASEINSLGIVYLDQIEAMGLEKFYQMYVESFPERLNLNALTALIGALEDEDWRQISDSQKAAAKALIRVLRRTRGPL